MAKKNYLTKRTGLGGKVIKARAVNRGYRTLPGGSSETSQEERWQHNQMKGLEIKVTRKATDYETELGK